MPDTTPTPPWDLGSNHTRQATDLRCWAINIPKANTFWWMLELGAGSFYGHQFSASLGHLPPIPAGPARLGWIRQVPVPVLRAGKEKDTHTYDGSSGQTFARMLKIAVADSHGSGNAYASITALCKITPRGVPWKSFTIKRGDTQHCSPSGTHPNARCCRFPGGARRAKPEGRTARV